jgi:hypothetical protein
MTFKRKRNGGLLKGIDHAGKGGYGCCLVGARASLE